MSWRNWRFVRNGTFVYFKLINGKVKVEFVRTSCNGANQGFSYGIITSGFWARKEIRTAIKTSGYWFGNVCVSCKFLWALLNFQESRGSSSSFPHNTKVLSIKKYRDKGIIIIIIIMNIANSVLWKMATILKANKFNLFVFSVLIVFWHHSPNFLDTSRR
jgi:hypothetical protein